jgi:hypothetical protein
VLKEMSRRSIRTLNERLDKSGIRLINERFPVRRLAFKIDSTLKLR